MKIGFYKWSETDNATKARILQRSGANIDALTDQIRPIIENVRQNGESALIQYAKQFDHADLSCLKVSEDELKTARATLDPDLKAAIDHCAGNVRRFHEEQMRRVEREWFFEVEPGVLAGKK